MNQPTDNKPPDNALELPPELTWPQQWLVKLAWSIGGIAVSYTVIALCTRESERSPCLIYVALAILPACVGLHLFVRRHLISHRARVIDPSIVVAIFVEANSISPRWGEGNAAENIEDKLWRPEPYNEKKQRVLDEMERLRGIGEKAWTEYQILPLKQMLIEFLKTDDLISQAHSTLEDLEDYADEDAYGGYDRKHYGQWDERVRSAIKMITDLDIRKGDQRNDSDRDNAAQSLRATLITLIEHVTDYEKNWAEGSVIYRSLSIFCSVAIPVLLTIGLLPVAYFGVGSPKSGLYFFHWAALAMAGAFTTVLRGFHCSNAVEVGNTEGKREFWRTAHGAILGLVAGVLTFSGIAGGLIVNGGVVPDLGNPNLKHTGLSVMLAFSSGFFFEQVFEKLLPSKAKE